jgi:glycogen operon protein
MHVDGFRFDLAATLGREGDNRFDQLSAFFELVAQDPVIGQAKLIAEPWDVGDGGYQVGEFPPLWTEWNGKYRDTVRSFWAFGEGGVRDLAYRLSGSSDLYGDDGRRPFASVNFVTAHDGFTLRDLVTYDRKHNEANGEGNGDGTDDNRSWNHGVEGETDDAAIQADRVRTLRNLLTTQLLSTGVPMLVAGDELGRTQGGNNNAYCQDDEISWLDWDLRPWQHELLDWTRALLVVRRAHPVFRHRHYLEGRPAYPGGLKDLAWFRSDGTELTDADWFSTDLTTVGMCLSGDGLRARTRTGERRHDDTFLLVVHGGPASARFTLPDGPWAQAWAVVLDTTDGRPLDVPAAQLPAGSALELGARSAMLLRATPPARS